MGPENCSCIFVAHEGEDHNCLCVLLHVEGPLSSAPHLVDYNNDVMMETPVLQEPCAQQKSLSMGKANHCY